MPRDVHPQVHSQGQRPKKPASESAGVVLRARDIEAMFAVAPNAIALFDQAGRLVRSNRQFEALLASEGHPDALAGGLQERARNFHVRDVHGRRVPASRLPVARALRGDPLISIVGVDMLVRALDGRELDLHVVATPFSAHGNRVTGCVVVVNDLSATRTSVAQLQNAIAQVETLSYEAEARTRERDAILGAIADGMLLYDSNGKLVQANDVALALLGVAAAETAPGEVTLNLVERQLAEFTQYDDVEGFALPEQAQPLARVLRGEVVSGRETADAVRPLHGGTEQVLYLSAAPIYAEKRLMGAVLLLRDVTERRRLQHQAVPHASQIESIFEAMTEGLAVFDCVGNVVRMNAAARQLLGYVAPDRMGNEPSDAEGTYASQREQERQLAVVVEVPLQRILKGETLTLDHAVDIPSRRLDGAEVVLAVGGAPVYNHESKVSGAVLSVRDVTETRRADAARAEVMNVVSHELRTPLTTFTIGIDLVQKQAKKNLPATPEAIALLTDGVALMTHLVSDLIDVARMEGGRLALKLVPQDLRTLCRDVVTEQVRTMQRAIALHLPRTSAIADVDRVRISQVLTNLVSNALKYSPAESPVSLRLRRQGMTARLEVRDEGPGIPAEAKAHLFERFFRVPGVNALSGSGVGLGLGLFIARSLIELHGGTIGVDTQFGRGSTFWFTLPLLNGTAG